MKFIDVKIMAGYLIVTKGKLIIDLWVSKLGVVDGRAKKEAEN